MKYLKPFNESNDELLSSIKDILADATDEGIELTIYDPAPFLDVILYKTNKSEPFTLKDVKPSIDTLINMLKDENYKVIKVEIMDDTGTSSKYELSKYEDPWDYAQLVISDNSFQRSYPDRDFQLKVTRITFKSN